MILCLLASALADVTTLVTVSSAVVSGVISVTVLVFGFIQYKQIARKDFVDELSRRVDKCETDHADCERERTRLTKLTVELLQDSRSLADRLLVAQRELEDKS